MKMRATASIADGVWHIPRRTSSPPSYSDPLCVPSLLPRRPPEMILGLLRWCMKANGIEVTVAIDTLLLKSSRGGK